MAVEKINRGRSQFPSKPLANGVRAVTMAEYKQAAACLAAAFKDDDVVRYPVYTGDTAEQSADAKWQLHVAILECMVIAHIHKGLVTTVGPDFNSVAIWCLPGKTPDWFTLVRSGLWNLYFKMSVEGRKRFYTEFLPLLHDTKANILGERDDESYYLVYIGTKPGHEGKGYAKALIEHITKQADLNRRACYLESSAAKNIPMYKKRGFAIRKTVYLNYADAPVAMDIMVREPAAPIVSLPPISFKDGRSLVPLRAEVTRGLSSRRASTAA
ncbi:MAG: hypothetical protein M1825_003110 [Sarcosagium campestre]|nr:MAG: hypothetical protein M1825_003110 [Sarcosagium campestre]